MSTIREDLVGVIWYADENGTPQSLQAGDDIPEGVEVGEHLLGELKLPRSSDAPAGNASLEVWQEYAKSQGVSDDDIDGLSRNELREQFGN